MNLQDAGFWMPRTGSPSGGGGEGGRERTSTRGSLGGGLLFLLPRGPGLPWQVTGEDPGDERGAGAGPVSVKRPSEVSVS